VYELKAFLVCTGSLRCFVHYVPAAQFHWLPLEMSVDGAALLSSGVGLEVLQSSGTAVQLFLQSALTIHLSA